MRKVLHILSKNKVGMENTAIKLNCQNTMPTIKPVIEGILFSRFVYVCLKLEWSKWRNIWYGKDSD